MNDIQSKIEDVKRFLATKFIRVDKDWLQGCVEYLLSDNTSRYTQIEINKLTYEQWLLNDIREICPVGCLPSNISSNKLILPNSYVLQVNCVVDIGTPAYQQLQTLRRVDLTNVEVTTKENDKISSHRMLKLYLTDGLQDIAAIEYKQMRNLTTDITPGCKVLIKGPVECRRGLILLEEKNLELLGGEVEDLVRCNSLINLLTNILGVANENTLQENQNVHQQPAPQPSAPSPQLSAASASASTSKPVAIVTGIQISNQDFNDDEDFDLNQLAQIEDEINNTNKRSLEPTIDQPIKKLRIDESVDRLINNTNFDLCNDFFEEEERAYPIVVASKPFVYLKQLKMLNTTGNCGKVFHVKAQIYKLLSKLSIGKDGWSLKCTLIDGSDSLDVSFTSDVLTKLVGYTPAEMNQIKKQMSTKPELKEKAMSALEHAKENLQILYSIVEITIKDGFHITNLIEYNESHVIRLKERLNFVT